MSNVTVYSIPLNMLKTLIFRGITAVFASYAFTIKLYKYTYKACVMLNSRQNFNSIIYLFEIMSIIPERAKSGCCTNY